MWVISWYEAFDYCSCRLVYPIFHPHQKSTSFVKAIRVNKICLLFLFLLLIFYTLFYFVFEYIQRRFLREVIWRSQKSSLKVFFSPFNLVYRIYTPPWTTGFLKLSLYGPILTDRCLEKLLFASLALLPI